MVVPPCDIEGGRSSGCWGLTLGEGGDGEGGGGGEGLHQTADRLGVATHYDEAKVWRKGIGKTWNLSQKNGHLMPKFLSSWDKIEL